MMRLNTETGRVIMSWEPDLSPQVMTVITTSPKPLKEQELR
jgi:hypothetical protein